MIIAQASTHVLSLNHCTPKPMFSKSLVYFIPYFPTFSNSIASFFISSVIKTHFWKLQHKTNSHRLHLPLNHQQLRPMKHQHRRPTGSQLHTQKFQYILNPAAHVCNDPVYLLVIVTSTTHNAMDRNYFRSRWKTEKYKDKTIATVFVTGMLIISYVNEMAIQILPLKIHACCINYIE